MDIKALNIRLSIFFGDYDRVISMLENTHFRTEEGATFNIHVYWFDAHLLRGIKKMNAGQYNKAEKNFFRAMEFPLNLESERDAKIGIALYYLGMNNKLKGHKAKAKEYLTKMTNYTYETGWGAGSYPEINFYKSLANKELGISSEVDKYFQKLISNGNKILQSKINKHTGRVTPSLARRKSNNDRQASAYFYKGLGYLGQGNKDKAEIMFHQALDMNPTIHGQKYIYLMICCWVR